MRQHLKIYPGKERKNEGPMGESSTDLIDQEGETNTGVDQRHFQLGCTWLRI